MPKLPAEAAVCAAISAPENAYGGL